MANLNLNQLEQREKSMIDIAYDILNQKDDHSRDYHSLLQEVAEIRGMTEEEIKERIGHLYTEMTLDGRFVNLGANQWGLRAWYPVDQTHEELSQTNKPSRRRGADEDDDDFYDEDDEFDEFEDLEDELDELASEDDEEEDEDEDLFDDEDDLDESFDEDLDESIEEEDDEELL